MRKKFLITTTVLFASLLTFISVVKAQDEEEDSLITTREEWHADDEILSFEADYSLPRNIKIILLEKQNERSDSLLDVRELYYYFASRSGYGDLPFHYLVAQDGKVYEGNASGVESITTITDDSNTVYIAYLVDGSDGLTITTYDSVKEILLQVMNKYAIPSENVTVSDLSYSFGERVKLINVEAKKASSKWQEDLKLLREDLNKSYSPRDLKYSLEVTEVTLPEEELDPGSEATIKLKIKNTGELNIYAEGASNIFISTKDDERSSFYLADTWDSFSRISLLESSQRLLAGEESEFSFKAYVPIYPPEKSGDFVLRSSSGEVIKNTGFKVTLKIKNPDEKIIEILDTPTGYLNVRNTPGYGDVVTKVSPGERFLVKAEENGYYKIDVNGKEGWVIRTYVKEIN
jgi:uncharacterized protein YgiM (DUF1202 family)